MVIIYFLEDDSLTKKFDILLTNYLFK